MNIHGVSERDIEDYLYLHPECLGMTEWIARQFVVPSGRIDLLGLKRIKGVSVPNIIVVELKSHQINSNALAQAARYRKDIQNAINEKIHDLLFDYGNSFLWNTYCESNFIGAMVVGVGDVDKFTLMEANAIRIDLRIMNLSLTIETGGNIVFKDYFKKEYKTQIEEMQENSIIANYPYEIVSELINYRKEWEKKHG